MSGTEWIPAALVRLLGTTNWEVEPVPSFAGNQVFLARSGGHRVVVKCAERQGLAAEAAVCDRVRRHGVCAPEVLAVELDAGPGPYLVMRAVPGHPVEPTDPVFRAVGAHLRALHEIRLPGFGPLVGVSPATLAGVAGSWDRAMVHDVDNLEPVVTAGLLGEALPAAIVEAFDRHRDVLQGVDQGVLVHSDVHPRHVYAHAGVLTGLIDWGDAGVGDPLFDLGRIRRADERALSLVLEGYGDLPFEGEDLQRRLHLYAVVFIVSSIVGEFRAGAPWPAWFELQAEALASHLEAL